MFWRVLFPTDFSRFARQLIECLDELKAAGTEKICVAHVVEPAMAHGLSSSFVNDVLAMRKFAEGQLREIRNALAFTMPLFLRFFDFFLPLADAYSVPLQSLFGNLLFLLVIPVFVGLGTRARYPEFVSRYGKRLRQIGFVALAALIAFILYQTRELFFSNWWEITKAAAVFILASMILGWALGRLFQMRTTDNFTLSVEYGTRNVGITTAMAIVVLHRTDFATFAAFYFLLEAVIILPIIAIYRKIDRW